MTTRKKKTTKTTRPKTVKLGNHVRDVYTGFEGLALARTEWLYGCSRILIEPMTLDKDGKVRTGEWFDEQRVEVVKASVKVDLSSGANPGGPQKDPSYSQRDPSR